PARPRVRAAPVRRARPRRRPARDAARRRDHDPRRHPVPATAARGGGELMRVLVTGMGGELGTRVAQLLEERAEVSEIAGFDIWPPRRRLRRSEFHRIEPHDQERITEVVHDFAPEIVIHYGVSDSDPRL